MIASEINVPAGSKDGGDIGTWRIRNPGFFVELSILAVDTAKFLADDFSILGLLDQSQKTIDRLQN